MTEKEKQHWAEEEEEEEEGRRRIVLSMMTKSPLVVFLPRC